MRKSYIPNPKDHLEPLGDTTKHINPKSFTLFIGTGAREHVQSLKTLNPETLNPETLKPETLKPETLKPL